MQKISIRLLVAIFLISSLFNAQAMQKKLGTLKTKLTDLQIKLGSLKDNLGNLKKRLEGKKEVNIAKLMNKFRSTYEDGSRRTHKGMPHLVVVDIEEQLNSDEWQHLFKMLNTQHNKNDQAFLEGLSLYLGDTQISPEALNNIAIFKDHLASLKISGGKSLLFKEGLFSELTNLKILNLSNNKHDWGSNFMLPNDIGTLAKLQKLDLSDNGLNPEKIKNILLDSLGNNSKLPKECKIDLRQYSWESETNVKTAEELRAELKKKTEEKKPEEKEIKDASETEKARKKTERLKKEQERLEQERIDREREEHKRLEKEEQQRRALEQYEKEEKRRIEQERLERENRENREKLERERKLEEERKEERKEAHSRETLEQERKEQERLDQVERERKQTEMEREDAERKAKEKEKREPEKPKDQPSDKPKTLEEALKQATQTGYLNLANMDIELTDAQIEKLFSLALSKINLSGITIKALPFITFYKSNIKELILSNVKLSSIDFPSSLNSTLEVLDLSNNDLQNLPKNIQNLTALKEIKLAGNKFKSLPAEIFKLTKLTELNLSGLGLEGKLDIPDYKYFGYSPSNLEVLDLSNNSLTALSTDIDQLKKLKEIKLSGNKFKTLPAAIFKLTKLTELNLSGLGLEGRLDIPDYDYFRLSPSNLEVLDLSNNSLTALSDNINELKELREIKLSGNKFKTLPAGIFKLVKVKKLNLSGLGLTSLEIPTFQYLNLFGSSLEVLDLSENNFTSFPEDIGRLKALKTIIFTRSGISLSDKQAKELKQRIPDLKITP